MIIIENILSNSTDFTSSMKNPPKKMLSDLVNHLISEGLLTDTISLGYVKFMGKFTYLWRNLTRDLWLIVKMLLGAYDRVYFIGLGSRKHSSFKLDCSELQFILVHIQTVLFILISCRCRLCPRRQGSQSGYPYHPPRQILVRCPILHRIGRVQPRDEIPRSDKGFHSKRVLTEACR